LIQELSRALQARLEEGLRSEVPDDAPVLIYLVHPQELERASELPVAALYLWELEPESRYRATGYSFEQSGEGGGETLRPAPLWLSCRFAFAVRGRRPEEEHSALEAALLCLREQPVIEAESLASLKEERGLAERRADRFPIQLESRPELWRTIGLPRHRLLLTFSLTVPIVARRGLPALRVQERRLELAIEDAPDHAAPLGGGA
jgi:hypothetical protein